MCSANFGTCTHTSFWVVWFDLIRVCFRMVGHRQQQESVAGMRQSVKKNAAFTVREGAQSAVAVAIGKRMGLLKCSERLEYGEAHRRVHLAGDDALLQGTATT